MPRTPAPLTVKALSGSRWQVFDAQGVLVAAFFSDADARAFVALPALEHALMEMLTLWEGRYGNAAGPYEPNKTIALARAALAGEVDEH
jgi:hypothetical protein